MKATATLDQFRHAIQSAGLTPPADIIADGQLHRFASNGDHDDDAGWYVVFPDGIQAGSFGCWRAGIKQNWSAKSDLQMSATERAAHLIRISELCRIREVEEEQRHVAAARRAQALWDQATPAHSSHPYLEKKEIQPNGLRVDSDNRLLIPVTIGNAITSLQFIDADGKKQFFPGGRVKGGSFRIGNAIEVKVLLVCEGYATAASVLEATSHPVVVAFNAGNLSPVVQNLRALHPAATIVVCGDHDQNGVGQEKAREAATTVGGLTIVPDDVGMDWNDVRVQHGLDVLRTRMATVLNSSCNILDEVYKHLGRFVVYPSDSAHVAHCLWVAHTHLMDQWESTPRLAFLSPEPGSGKTRALEITETLVPRPVASVNATSAYLFRKVSDPDGLPTILYDEIDTLFGPKAKEHEDVRALINAGHRRGASAGRCVMKGRIIETEELPAFCAVALAGLGNLPDTILTRSIIIKMHRRAPREPVEPYRRRFHATEGYELRDRLAKWAIQIRPTLETCPTMPETITDRNADVWECLLSVADAAGGSWPAKARGAAVALVADVMRGQPSLGLRLLSDLKLVFKHHDILSTVDLLSSLILMDESPWGDLKGKPMDARRLANLLRPYGITSKVVRIGASTPRGYSKTDFYDAWVRYLPIEDDGDGAVSNASATSATSTKTPNQDEFIFEEDAAC